MMRRYSIAILLAALCALWGQAPTVQTRCLTPVAAAAPLPALTITAGVRFRSLGVGHKERLTAVVRSTRYLGTSLVDFEVYDSRGARVFQSVKKVKIGLNRLVTVMQTFTVPRSAFAGTYYFKIGVFSVDWKRRYIWVDDAQSFEIHGQTLPHITATGSIPARKVYPRQAVYLMATVTARGHVQPNLLIDIEIYHGETKVYQRGITGVHLQRNRVTRITQRWIVPANAARGAYVMRVGVFGGGWSPLYAWNGSAWVFSVA